MLISLSNNSSVVNKKKNCRFQFKIKLTVFLKINLLFIKLIEN